MNICTVNKNGVLSIDQRDIIYQNNDPQDCIMFYITSKYNNIDILNYTIILRWIDINGEIHSDVLKFIKYVDNNNYAIYSLHRNSEFTKHIGYNNMQIIFGKIYVDTPSEYILKTNSVYIEIQQKEGAIS